MDRIVVEKVAGSDKERRRCVECGYSDEQSLGASPEPRIRLGSSKAADQENVDNDETPVRILEPGKSD